MKVVLDANVVVSGFTHAGSVPDLLLRHWYAGRYQLVVSDPLIGETTRTFTKPYFSARLSDLQVRQFILLLETDADVAEMTAVVTSVESHSEDDLILATAVSGNAIFLVTGDRQLQRLGTFQGLGSSARESSSISWSGLSKTTRSFPRRHCG